MGYSFQYDYPKVMKITCPTSKKNGQSLSSFPRLFLHSFFKTSKHQPWPPPPGRSRDPPGGVQIGKGRSDVPGEERRVGRRPPRRRNAPGRLDQLGHEKLGHARGQQDCSRGRGTSSGGSRQQLADASPSDGGPPEGLVPVELLVCQKRGDGAVPRSRGGARCGGRPPGRRALFSVALITLASCPVLALLVLPLARVQLPLEPPPGLLLLAVTLFSRSLLLFFQADFLLPLPLGVVERRGDGEGVGGLGRRAGLWRRESGCSSSRGLLGRSESRSRSGVGGTARSIFFVVVALFERLFELRFEVDVLVVLLLLIVVASSSSSCWSSCASAFFLLFVVAIDIFASSSCFFFLLVAHEAGVDLIIVNILSRALHFSDERNGSAVCFAEDEEEKKTIKSETYKWSSDEVTLLLSSTERSLSFSLFHPSSPQAL